jgi:hypothetical protein
VDDKAKVADRLARGAAVMAAIAGRPVAPGEAITKQELDPPPSPPGSNRKGRRAALARYLKDRAHG